MIKYFFLALRQARIGAEPQEDIEGAEKFNDKTLQEAAELIEELRPSDIYWMTNIPAQMTVIAQ
jgi:hypothetical protein